MLPLTLRLYHHAHAVAGLRGGHGFDRCAEIGDVQSAAEPVGQARLHELDNQTLPLLADIDANLVVRQGDHNAPCAISTAAEVDVFQRRRRAVGGFCKCIARLGVRRFGGFKRDQE